MKIEFIKKTNAVNEVYYYTTVNDDLVMGSLSNDETTARKNFENIIANKGQLASIEVLDVTIID